MPQEKGTAEGEVRQLRAGFITAFDNLDWPALRKCWVEHPVMFQPAISGDVYNQ
jgi:hypothetical protein